ncbi:MAG: hemolysin family protein [Ignavibacteriaceae bacterium]
MDIDWSVKLFAIIFFLGASAFFSGSEVALFSLDKRKINSQFGGHPIILNYVNSLLEQPERLLVTILIGNTVMNVAVSIIAVALAIELAPRFGIAEEIAISFQIITLTLLILIFGELLPKVFASKKSVGFTKTVVIPLYWINVMIYPLSETLTEIIKASTSKIHIHKHKTVLTKDEIGELSNMRQEKGTLEEEEHEIIKSIVSFRNILASEIMTPRVDIKAIQSNASFNQIVSTINETGHSRFPLYNEDLDAIVGILSAKDILPFIKNGKPRKAINLSAIARNAMFVPKTKKINNLLREFQSKNTHIAIVVDEYGGTAGLITLEDIIEEVVGEIWDEYDKEEDIIKKIDEDRYLVLGKTPIDEINEAIGSEVITEETDFETIGGLVFKKAGSIPNEGYSFKINNFKFTVKEIHRKRIKKVLIEKESEN